MERVSEIGTMSTKTAGAYLGISRIGVKDIRKEFAGASDAGNDETVNVEAVDDKIGGRAGNGTLLWGKRLGVLLPRRR